MPNIETLPISLEYLRRTRISNKLGVMEKLFGSLIGPKGVCWVVTSTGIPWKVDLGNPCHRWMVYGDYADPGFWRWARSQFSRKVKVVDSGTNIGQFIPYYQDINNEAKILAFEPSPYCYSWVKDCLRVNGNIKIDLIKMGLSSEKKNLSLVDEEGANGLWGKTVEEGSSEDIEVEVTTLSDALYSRGVSEVDLWKLDVEGHELEALKGAKKHLSKNKINALYVEVSPKHRREDVKFLKKYGYSAYKVKSNGDLLRVREHNKKEENLLFLH